MSKESKRMFFLAALAFAWIWGAQFLMDRLGFLPKRNPAQVARPAANAPDPAPVPPVALDPSAAAKPAPGLVAAPADSQVKTVPPEKLVMGGLGADDGYKMKVQLAQVGAGVEMLELKEHEAERVAKKVDRLPLRLIQPDSEARSSFAIQLVDVRDPTDRGETSPANLVLLPPLWDVLPDAEGRIVRPLFAEGKPAPSPEIGQEVVFQGTLQGTPKVTITKTFRLLKGADGLEMKLEFSSPEADRKLTYALYGPHGLPVEGEWYTSLYREALIGSVDGTSTKIETRLANDIAKLAEPERFTSLPLKFAGVENQYFAVFYAPDPVRTPETRVDAESSPIVVRPDPKDNQRADITVAMTSRPIEIGPNRPVTHQYRIFAGPKNSDALLPYGAEGLAAYRKSGSFAIPGASWLAQSVISPLLQRIYAATATISQSLGGKTGNYGIAIILLTITVRLILFPLSRKQAMSAKKMQDLQPLMTELKEKYKDDKEAQTRETFALYKRHGVNPVGGCLLGLIQLPIFVGLWQALNNSVALRHAPFLWIDNLAAPDMLLKFPSELPFLGNYFNILPLAVVGLMLVQTKLFSPPATTPDQEMTQKMMKYMMVFMGFMFYKVPSGLGIYFITSSSWAICERLLLPKMIKSKPVSLDAPMSDPIADARPSRPKLTSSGSASPGNAQPAPPATGLGGFRERLKERFEQLKDEAAKDRTVRNNDKDRDWGKGSGNGNRPRPKPGGKR